MPTTEEKKQEKILQELAPLLARHGLSDVLLGVAECIKQDAGAVLVRYGEPTTITEIVSSDLHLLALDIEIAVDSFKSRYGR